MLRSICVVFVITLVFGSMRQLLAVEHKIETLDEAAPADVLAEDVRSLLNSTGYRVVRGGSRTICEIWLCKEWRVNAGFEPTSEVLYPFEPGQLIGVLRFRRRDSDFRDQTISRGVYTLRYGQQPVDGNHEGTSPTRDFLLLVNAETDQTPDPMATEMLLEASAEAAGSSHPAMLCLQQQKGSGAEANIRHDENRDWWIARLTGKAAAGDARMDLALELVVAGHADE